jgi:hypothetical protein
MRFVEMHSIARNNKDLGGSGVVVMKSKYY